MTFFGTCRRSATITNYDPKTGLLRTNIIMFHKLPGGHFRKSEEVHVQRVYEKKVIRAALENTGFSKIKISESSETGGRILGIASKAFP